MIQTQDRIAVPCRVNLLLGDTPEDVASVLTEMIEFVNDGDSGTDRAKAARMKLHEGLHLNDQDGGVRFVLHKDGTHGFEVRP